jgi:hypothetical protein
MAPPSNLKLPVSTGYIVIQKTNGMQNKKSAMHMVKKCGFIGPILTNQWNSRVVRNIREQQKIYPI